MRVGVPFDMGRPSATNGRRPLPFGPGLNLEGRALHAWQAFWAVSLILICVVRIDPWIHGWVATWPEPVLGFFRQITDIGRSHWWLVPTGVGAILFRALARRARGMRERQALLWGSIVSAFVFLAVATTGLLTVALKYAIGRARPKLLAEHGVFGFQPLGLDADFAGFPSGHANTVVAVAICLIFLWPRFWPWFVGFAALSASSRIIVGAHYPSDVVAGAYVGILTTFAWRRAFAERQLLFRRASDGRLHLRGRHLRAWMRQRVGTALGTHHLAGRGWWRWAHRPTLERPSEAKPPRDDGQSPCGRKAIRNDGLL